MTTKGYCFCRSTRWEFDGDPAWGCYCHCDDCRRNCSAPVVAWLGVALKNFRWTGDQPKTLESSAGVFRHFCEKCGSPMGFEAKHYPGGMHVYAASMEQSEVFEPTFHVNYESKLPWLKLNDDLPRFEGTLLNTPKDPDGYGS